MQQHGIFAGLGDVYRRRRVVRDTEIEGRDRLNIEGINIRDAQRVQAGRTVGGDNKRARPFVHELPVPCFILKGRCPVSCLEVVETALNVDAGVKA
jgi:hypothetical protein